MRDKVTSLVAATDASYVRYTAFFFMLLSFPIYGLILWVPFSPLVAEQKIMLSAGLFIASEIAFWGGAAILGKEVFDRFRPYFSLSNWIRLCREYWNL